MKKDTYYFSHDASAKDDPKCMILIDQLGLEGYGIFWVIVETLRTQPDYKCPITILPSLARRYNTSQEKMKAVVFNYDLFVIENDTLFFSDSLMNRMSLVDAKRKKLSEAGKRGYAIKSGSFKPPLNENQATLKQLNKIKSNEIKLNNKILDISFRKNEFKENAIRSILTNDNDLLNTFIEYWTEHSANAKKMRFELQKVFDIQKRFKTFEKNKQNWNNGKSTTTQVAAKF